MFISVLELFKIGIGPSSSHTLGPMLAARQFVEQLLQPEQHSLLSSDVFIRCTLKGSLAFTGKGHSTDRAVALGLHGYTPEQLANMDVEQLEQLITPRTKAIMPVHLNGRLCNMEKLMEILKLLKR